MGNCDKERRVLDVYYTDKGTKLSVENGLLIEQTIKSSPSSHLGIHDGIPCNALPRDDISSRKQPQLHGTSCHAPPLYAMKWDPSFSSLIPSGMPFSSGDSCKSVSYDPPPKEPPLSEEEKTKLTKLLNEQTTRIPKPALAYYNGRNRTKYELLDSVSSNGFMRNGLWYHCNFTATNGNSPESSQECSLDSATMLFFAELKIVRLKSGSHKYLVTACRPIDGAKTVIGCDKCLEIIHHPSRGFRQGLYHFKPRTLRPRSNGKAARKF